MALTPDDVVNYPLKQSMRGYSIRQVDELLDQVADELERLHRELDDAHRRLEQAERKAETLDETESTLRRTLVTAQRAAEETVEAARRRADELLDEARREADGAREQALEEARRREDELRGRHDRLRETIEELEAYESSFREQLRGMLRQQLERLDDDGTRPDRERPSVQLPDPPPDPHRPTDDGVGDPAADRPEASPDEPAVDEEIFGRSGPGERRDVGAAREELS